MGKRLLARLVSNFKTFDSFVLSENTQLAGNSLNVTAQTLSVAKDAVLRADEFVKLKAVNIAIAGTVRASPPDYRAKTCRDAYTPPSFPTASLCSSIDAVVNGTAYPIGIVSSAPFILEGAALQSPSIIVCAPTVEATGATKVAVIKTAYVDANSMFLSDTEISADGSSSLGSYGYPGGDIVLRARDIINSTNLVLSARGSNGVLCGGAGGSIAISSSTAKIIGIGTCTAKGGSGTKKGATGVCTVEGCRAGSAKRGSKFCLDCDIGQAPQNNTCVDCEEGYVASRPGSPVCTPCGKGKYQVWHEQKCSVCQVGKYNGLEACMGEYDRCLRCAPRPRRSKFINETGGSVVHKCPYACFDDLVPPNCVDALENALGPFFGSIQGICVSVAVLLLVCITLSILKGARDRRRMNTDYHLSDMSRFGWVERNTEKRAVGDNESRGFVCRLYFLGTNSSGGKHRWTMSDDIHSYSQKSLIALKELKGDPKRVLSSLKKVVDASSFPKSRTSVADVRRGHVLDLLREIFLFTFARPFAHMFKTARRKARASRMAESFQGKFNEYKFGCTSDFSIGYVDVYAPSSESRNILPLVILLAGEGSYHNPYFLDPNDTLVRDIPKMPQIASFIDESWVTCINEINTRLRCITPAMVKRKLLGNSCKRIEDLIAYLVRVEGTLGELTLSLGVFRAHQCGFGSSLGDISYQPGILLRHVSDKGTGDFGGDAGPSKTPSILIPYSPPLPTPSPSRKQECDQQYASLSSHASLSSDMLAPMTPVSLGKRQSMKMKSPSSPMERSRSVIRREALGMTLQGNREESSDAALMGTEKEFGPLTIAYGGSIAIDRTLPCPGLLFAANRHSALESAQGSSMEIRLPESRRRFAGASYGVREVQRAAQPSLGACLRSFGRFARYSRAESSS